MTDATADLDRPVLDFTFELTVSAEAIENLFVSAIEGGDPVTNARKGGWCWGIYHSTHKHEPPPGQQPWYADTKFYSSADFHVEIIEVDNEDIFDPDCTLAENIASGALKVHAVRRRGIIKGLTVMASKFPKMFSQIHSDN